MSDPSPTFDIPKEGWGALVVRGESAKVQLA